MEGCGAGPRVTRATGSLAFSPPRPRLFCVGLEHGCGFVGFLPITIGVFLMIRIIVMHRDLL